MDNVEDHVCEQLTHEEQIKYYERSQRRWVKKRESPDGMSYTTSNHRDWVDEFNFGVSHLGMHPNKLPRDDIRFDIFHLRSAITKRLMTYVRKFILSQTCQVMKTFESQVLTKIWKSYHILVWTLNKQFNSFTGEEVK